MSAVSKFNPHSFKGTALQTAYDKRKIKPLESPEIWRGVPVIISDLFLFVFLIENPVASKT